MRNEENCMLNIAIVGEFVPQYQELHKQQKVFYIIFAKQVAATLKNCNLVLGFTHFFTKLK